MLVALGTVFNSIGSVSAPTASIIVGPNKRFSRKACLSFFGNILILI